MKILNIAKTLSLISLPLFAVNTTKVYAQKPDSVIVDRFERSITPQGIKDSTALLNAPNPNIKIAGEDKKAGIVVDISRNILYRYDKDGNPINAYLIASGKKALLPIRV